jgi:hypothetical protein
MNNIHHPLLLDLTKEQKLVIDELVGAFTSSNRLAVAIEKLAKVNMRLIICVIMFY